MRIPVLGLAAAILAIGLLPIAAAKQPYHVQIHAFASPDRIATITEADDLLRIMSGLYGPDAVREPLIQRPATWDYRILLVYSPQPVYSEEYSYLLPRAERPGLVCCLRQADPLGFQETALRSPTFDAVIMRYVPEGRPSLPEIPRASPATIGLASAAAVATFIALFVAVGRRSRARSRPHLANPLSEPSA